MENEELFQLAYKGGEGCSPVADGRRGTAGGEAEALADKVERAQAQARIMPRQVQTRGPSNAGSASPYFL